ncbi:hypothetical protein [Flavobacterium panacis]|nr:hypothetical protein [Flavobacterium panacis]MCR4032898.1 hypothetical protein [Flavobacterium panacis]
MAIVSAYNNPPPPKMYARTASVNSEEFPDEGDPEGDPDFGGAPDMPIDQNKIMLLIGGLVLGTAVIYRKHIKKASN